MDLGKEARCTGSIEDVGKLAKQCPPETSKEELAGRIRRRIFRRQGKKGFSCGLWINAEGASCGIRQVPLNQVEEVSFTLSEERKRQGPLSTRPGLMDSREDTPKTGLE